MKVCHIINNFFQMNPDTYEYTRNLAVSGVDVTFIVIKEIGSSYSQSISEVNVICVPMKRYRFSKLIYPLRFVFKVMAVLRNSEFDIIHIYAFRFCSVLPLLCKKSARKWVFHIITGSINNNRLLAKLSNRLTRLESRLFDHRIVVDKLVGELVLGPGTAFSVLPNGVDLERFKPQIEESNREQLGYKSDDILAIYSAKLAPQRDTQKLIRGFSIATKSEPRLKLMVVGDGPHIDQLKTLSKRLQAERSVTFAGYVSYPKMHRYLAVCDIGLAYVPIKMQYDSQPPLKTLEYLSTGLATIATDTAGNRKYVISGKNGILIKDNARDIAGALLKLARDASLRQTLSQQARKSVSSFSWSNIVSENLLPVYRDLLKTANTI